MGGNPTTILSINRLLYIAVMVAGDMSEFVIDSEVQPVYFRVFIMQNINDYGTPWEKQLENGCWGSYTEAGNVSISMAKKFLGAHSV